MIDHAERILEEHFPDCKEDLVIGDRQLGELVGTYRTSLFLIFICIPIPLFIKPVNYLAYWVQEEWPRLKDIAICN